MKRTLVLLCFSLALRAGGLTVDSVGLTVSDLDRSVEFYTKILHFEKVSERDLEGSDDEHLTGVFGSHRRVARLKLGDESIELSEYLAPRGRPAPVDARSNDQWFQHVAIVVADMDRAYAWLRQNKVQHASPSPQLLPDWNKNAGGIRAFYFKDPDGHPLEILAFPPDKGNAKWHQKTDRLFLGIDHTAIVVRNTDASLRFYRDLLGLTVAGESENYGIEQERLNNVFGAHLRITAVRSSGGPGIEFLEYLTPTDGRPYPSDEKSNDLIHWQTQARGHIDGAALRAAHVAMVAGDGHAVLVRDPDGHAVLISE